MPNQEKNSALTSGNILKGILLFAFPILIGNIFQQLYNIVDTAIIGNFLGDDSLAAVGATAPVYGLIIGFAHGITNGFAIIIARLFGAENSDGIRKATAMTIILSAAISFILTAAGLLALKPLLIFLKTPSEIIEESESYLGIIIAFSSVTMLYNMLAGMLRAIGNSRAPLYFLIVSTVVNIVLDILFVKSFGMGVAGAAYATVIAQVVSVILCVIYIIKKCPVFGVQKAAFFNGAFNGAYACGCFDRFGSVAKCSKLVRSAGYCGAHGSAENRRNVYAAFSDVKSFCLDLCKSELRCGADAESKKRHNNVHNDCVSMECVRLCGGILIR